MPEATSRSPSPVPAPPIAATPGPRAAHLLKLYNDAVTHTLKSCSYDNFSQCFPTPAKNVPDALEGLHKDFVRRLGERCNEEFESILRERNVVPALNDLDRLVDDARKRKQKAESEANGGPVQAPIPPHTLPAASLHLSLLTPSLMSQRDQLSAHLQTSQATNAELLLKVMQQREKIDELVSGLETVVQDIDGSLGTLQHDQMLELTAETVDMETAG